jgi:hypothetical protein
MDEWISLGGGGEGRAWSAYLITFSFVSYYFCKGDSYPGTCAQRDAEGGGFLMLWSAARPRPVPFVFFFLGVRYISLRDERRFLRPK